MSTEKIIDAEFVEEKSDSASSTSHPAGGRASSEGSVSDGDHGTKRQGEAQAEGAPGYGRKHPAEPRPTIAEAVADVLGAVPSAAKAAATVARAVGKENVADTIEDSGELAGHAAAVAASVPGAVKGTLEAVRPLRDAWSRFAGVAKEKGFVSRKAPRSVEHAPKTRHGRPMETEK